MRTIAVVLALTLLPSLARADKPHADKLPEGIWMGYDGEWLHVSKQLVALAQAIPEDKLAWRPAPGVRSTSEVFMHVAIANFWLLSLTGVKTPPLDPKLETTVKTKAQLVDWLQRSLDAVKAARAHATPAELRKKVRVFDRDTDADGIYLRIIVHANEHMGQLIAYARMNGIAPPWSN